MKPGLKFASGNALTAEDVVFSFQRAVLLDKTPAFIITQFGLTPENVDQMITFEGDTVTLKTDSQSPKIEARIDKAKAEAGDKQVTLTVKAAADARQNSPPRRGRVISCPPLLNLLSARE